MSAIVHNSAGAVPIHSWTEGVPFDHKALAQLRNVASLDFVGDYPEYSTPGLPAGRRGGCGKASALGCGGLPSRWSR